MLGGVAGGHRRVRMLAGAGADARWAGAGVEGASVELGLLARTTINIICVSNMGALALLPASPGSQQQCVGRGRDRCCMQSAAEGNCALRVLQH